MAEFEARPAPVVVEELPSNKAKVLTPPDMPKVVVVVNDNHQRNPAHREIQFQVKVNDKRVWEEMESLGWLQSQTYETGLQTFGVRNKGSATLNLKYP
jgi:hypothetical protein